MGWIPTVRLFKGSRTIKVNADDTLRFCKDGWERKKVNKQTTDPDVLAANAIADAELLAETGKLEAGKEETPAKTEPVKKEQEVSTVNLDDLQAE